MNKSIAAIFKELPVVLCVVSLLALHQASSLNAEEQLDKSKLKAQLIKHEGKVATVYKDSEGIPTIGVGFNLTRADAERHIERLGLNYDDIVSGKVGLTDAQINVLLEADIEQAITDAKSVVKNFSSLPEVRQRVIVDMVFNLGKHRFSQFKKMLAALDAKDYKKVAEEMKNSKWCGQVKSRCENLVKMMESGEDIG